MPARPGPLTSVAIVLLLAACTGGDPEAREASIELQRQNIEGFDEERSSVFDLFGSKPQDTNINVNKFIWAAALDTLSFLPVEAVDPFSGVLATGWGRVNGSAAPYRATVYVSGPALDARSLRVAVFRQSGGRAVAVSDEVASQVEDAILTRARQLRVEQTTGRG